MSRWIGLTGKMGAGKDFAFKAMVHLGAQVARVSFADGLRQEIAHTLGVEPFTKPYSELERKLQQWWGTDYRRDQNPDYWVDRAEFVASQVTLTTTMTPVFTDVRFPNEADMIVRNGGLLVQVKAGLWTREMRLGMVPPNHESETALDSYDWPEETYILHSMDEGQGYYRAIERLLSIAEIPHG